MIVLRSFSLFLVVSVGLVWFAGGALALPMLRVWLVVLVLSALGSGAFGVCLFSGCITLL